MAESNFMNLDASKVAREMTEVSLTRIREMRLSKLNPSDRWLAENGNYTGVWKSSPSEFRSMFREDMTPEKMASALTTKAGFTVDSVLVPVLEKMRLTLAAKPESEGPKLCDALYFAYNEFNSLYGYYLITNENDSATKLLSILSRIFKDVTYDYDSRGYDTEDEWF